MFVWERERERERVRGVALGMNYSTVLQLG